MKNFSHFTLILLISFFLTACNSSDRQLYLQVEVPPPHYTFDKISDFARAIEPAEWEDNSAMASNDLYTFRKVGSEASCVDVELFDVAKNTPVSLPDFIQQGDLGCLSSANKISFDGQWLSYHFYDEVDDVTRFEIYNHITKKRVVLDANVAPSSGHSCFWSADDLTLACVSVYEKQLNGLEKTILYVFELDETGDLEKASSFVFPQDQMIYFVCGSVCVVDENDFVFSSKNHTILYRGHLEIVPDQLFSLEY